MDGKADTDAYIVDAGKLLLSMSIRGFMPQHAVPVGPDGEVLGGAHRVACALALGISEIAVERKPDKVWAPAWDEQWFIDQGMSEGDLERLRQDWEAIR
jgi:hypothetical protein